MSNKNIYIYTAVCVTLAISIPVTWLATKEWRYDIQGKSMLLQAINSKKVAVEEAKAEFESAKYKRQADIERANGIAEANNIINNSLTDRYIRWLYVENIKSTSNQIIYLPTEAGLPILESGRLQRDSQVEE